MIANGVITATPKTKENIRIGWNTRNIVLSATNIRSTRKPDNGNE